MGSEKRERQREARLEKLEAEATEYRRARTKRLGIRFAVAAVVIVGALFAYSVLAGDDDDSSSGDESEEASADTGAMSSMECSGQSPLPEAWSNPEAADEVLAREAPDPAPPPADTPTDALEVEPLIEGEGDGAVAGDCVYVHYIGKIPDGTVFDESWSRETPFPVLLGQGMVIPGWDQGLVDAQIGERVRLVIGSANAYGEQGGGDAIPPNTPLAFEVDIVDIVPTDLSAATDDSGGETTSTAAAGETTTTAAAGGETTTSAPAAESTTAPTG